MNRCVAYVIVPSEDVKYQKLFVGFEVCTAVTMAVNAISFFFFNFIKFGQEV